MDRKQALKTARILATEVTRAKNEMKIPRHPRPFYVSFLVRDQEDWRVRARYGSIARRWNERQRNGFVDVRVGSRRSDQLQDGGLNDNDKSAESYSYVDLPFGDDVDGLRHGLWRLADARYREAVEDLLEKQSHEITYRTNDEGFTAFRKMDPVVETRWREMPPVDFDFWTERVERLSAALKKHESIADSHVEFEANHSVVIFASSEGSRRIQTHAVWSLEAYVWLLSDSGDAFPYTLKRTVADPDELPSDEVFLADVANAVRTLEALAKAPKLHSFCGPALLDPVPAGLLVHEALGHRLEGDRLLATGEGLTFKGALGQEVAPDFLSLYDDPTKPTFDDRSLVGHYRFDDEGVTSANARLIDNGTLRGFLTTRTGIGKRHRSNGHARGTYHRRPVSRMASLFVEARNGLSDEELHARFLEEIRRSEAPFGLRVIDATSGETTTDAYNFQAFLGEANWIARVYPDGREEWVRGLNFVGTPLNAVRNIVAAGSRCEIDNAWCGAESGYVPVSTVSPSLLLSELEMQAKPDTPYTPYTYANPLQKPKRRRR